MKKQTLAFIIVILAGIFFINLASALVIDSVSVNPSTIAPGQTADIFISLNNNEDYDLQDVSVSLDFTNVPLAPYNSASQYTIGEIREDKTKEAEFKVIAFENSAGIYKIPVKIIYTSDEENSTAKPIEINSLISVIVNSKPVIKVDYNGGLLLKNKNNKVTFKIINKGLEDVRFLDINLGTSSYYSITSEKSVYVGDVDNNDFQTADFDIFFNQNAPTNINVPVDITYKDIMNKEYHDIFNIQLKVYSSDKAQQLGLIPANNIIYIVIIIIVLIVIFFVYRAIRKRRKQRKINEQ